MSRPATTLVSADVVGISLEDRAELQAAHLDALARHAEAGAVRTLYPRQLRRIAATLRALAQQSAARP